MTIINNKRIHRVLAILAITTVVGGVAIAVYTQKLQNPIYWVKAGSFFNNGVIFELKGNDTAAIKAYDKAIKFNPNFAKAHEKRQELLKKLQQ